MSAPNVSTRFNILGAASQDIRPPSSTPAPRRLVPAYAPSREEWEIAFPGRPFPAGFARRPPLPGDALADPTEDECLNKEEISAIPTVPWKEAAARQREAWQEKKVEGDNCRTDDGEAMDCECDDDDERVENDDGDDDDDYDDDDDDDDASVGTEPAQGEGADQDVSMSNSDEFCCEVCQMEYEDDDEVKILPCSHFFHTECVSKWLQVRATCPLCRFDLKPQPDKPAPPMIRTSSGSMVNAAPLYVPIYGDFEAPGTRSSRVEDASVETNLQDAELVQALGGFVASGEVVVSTGSATEIPAFAIAPSTPPNPPQLPPVSARPSVSPTFALSSGLSPPTRPVRAVTTATSRHLPAASPNTIALSPVFVSTPPPNRVNPSLSPSMPSIGISPPAAITRSPINSPPHGGQSFGALSMSSFAPPAAAASRGFAPVFVAPGF